MCGKCHAVAPLRPSTPRPLYLSAHADPRWHPLRVGASTCAPSGQDTRGRNCRDRPISTMGQVLIFFLVMCADHRLPNSFHYAWCASHPPSYVQATPHASYPLSNSPPTPLLLLISLFALPRVHLRGRHQQKSPRPQPRLWRWPSMPSPPFGASRQRQASPWAMALPPHPRRRQKMVATATRTT